MQLPCRSCINLLGLSTVFAHLSLRKLICALLSFDLHSRYNLFVGAEPESTSDIRNPEKNFQIFETSQSPKAA